MAVIYQILLSSRYHRERVKFEHYARPAESDCPSPYFPKEGTGTAPLLALDGNQDTQ